MIHRKFKDAKKIFAVMVPITLLAFLIGSYSVDRMIFVPTSLDFDLYDGLGLTIVTLSVFAFNFMEDKPQKTSIEHL